MRSPEFSTKNSTEVASASSMEPWSEYKLEDGTVIRARLRLSGFRRFDGQYDVYGKTVYFNAQIIEYDVTVPPDLMQQPEES